MVIFRVQLLIYQRVIPLVSDSVFALQFLPRCKVAAHDWKDGTCGIPFFAKEDELFATLHMGTTYIYIYCIYLCVIRCMKAKIFVSTSKIWTSFCQLFGCSHMGTDQVLPNSYITYPLVICFSFLLKPWPM